MAIDDRLLQLIGDTHGLLEVGEFRVELLAALRRALPSDWASLNDIGPNPDSTVVIADPPPHADLIGAFIRYAHQNPLVAHYAETGDGRALRFSDVMSLEELHRLELWQQVYKPLRVDYQIAFTLPPERDRILGVALSRASSDFTDDERDLLDGARSFLIQAYRNALLHTDALAGAAARAGPPLTALTALGLTTRQAEVLRLLATGISQDEIATTLAISSRTVAKHLERCYRVLGVVNRAAAARVAWDAAG
jgi:DNA-binding CsgD family transcriptional regulator